MKQKSVIIHDLVNQYSNPSTEFVQWCCKFDSGIQICEHNKVYNAKSFLTAVRLQLEEASEVKIIVQGRDEEYAMAQIIRFFHHKDPENRLEGVI